MDQLMPRGSDASIWSAIDAKNFKQALKTVEKRLSKNPQDKYLKALSCYIYGELSQLKSEKVAVRLDARKHVSSYLKDLSEGPLLVEDDVLILYSEALEHNWNEPITGWRRTIGIRRWEMVKFSPKDLEIGLHNFRICLEKHDFTHAQQICNSLEKNFPSEHKYVLWNITLHYLISQMGYGDDNIVLSDRLSQAMIQKLAEATKEAKNVKSLPVRSLQTPEEAMLLHRIVDSGRGNTDKRKLEFYDDGYAGPESKIAKGSWKLWLDKLKLMEKTGHWQDLYALSSRLLDMARKDPSGKLEDARMGDWKVWQAFMKSAKFALDYERYLKVIQHETKAHLDKDSGCDKIYRRNAALAEVSASFEYLSECPEPYFVIGHPDLPREDAELLQWQDAKSQMVRVLLNYLDKNSGVPSVFSDIRDYSMSLDAEDTKEFLHRLSKLPKFGIAPLPFQDIELGENGQKVCLAEYHLVTASDITACVTKFKLIYTITSGLSEITRRAKLSIAPKMQIVCVWCQSPCDVCCKKCLATQARSSILTYGSAIDDNGRITKTLLPTDMHPADDFCILAAMCLIKIAGMSPFYAEDCRKAFQGKKATYILRAALLLEYAWSHSKANAQISLLLIRLYTQLGCGSLAMRAYQRLGLKQIQLMTLSYAMFDRISSLHPHPFLHLQDNNSKIPSPVEQLQKQQKVFRSFSGQINNNIYKSFEHGSYDSAIQLFEADYNMKHSLAIVSSFIELRKINRILYPDTALDLTSDGFDMLPEKPETVTKWQNNLDYGSFPNFEPNTAPEFVNYTQVGPGMSMERSRWEIVVERVRYHVDLEEDDPRLSESALWFKNDYPDLYIGDTPVGLNGTQIELFYYDVGTYLAEMLLAMQHYINQQWDFTHQTFLKISLRIQETLDMLITMPKGKNMPTFSSTLHPLYIAHDIATLVLKFHKYFKSSPCPTKMQKDDCTKCAKLARRVMTEVLKRSQITRKNMDESGWIDRVLDSVMEGETDEVHDEPQSIAGAFGSTIDADFLETWASEVVESWRDSVVGLACLKPTSDKDIIVDIEDIH